MMRAAARMYYLEGRSQQAVAGELAVSRSTVSRLLTAARREGVVRITVEPPTTPAAIASELARALGLREAVVCPSTRAPATAWHELAAGLAQALRIVDPGEGPVVVTSWGQTVWEVTANRLGNVPGALVAPMMAAADEPAPWYETNNVTRRVAMAIQGSPRLLHAPVHPSPALRAELLRDPDTLRTLRLWDRADMAILNIGAPPRLQPDYGPAHHVRDRDQLARAAGDVASRYFDVLGRPVPYDDENLFLGMTREQILNVPVRIGIAAGADKAPSIVGAGRAGLVDILVTDHHTARAVLDLIAGDNTGR